MISRALVAVLALALCGGAFAQEYQFEDNVRDLLASARQLTASGALEEGAIEFENVLAIDPLHREAALGLFDTYLQLGAIAAADELFARLGRMGVDTTQQEALKQKLEATRKSPPKRPPYTASLVAPPAKQPGGPTPPAGGDGLDDIELEAAPAPAASAAPAAPQAPASPAASELEIDL